MKLIRRNVVALAWLLLCFVVASSAAARDETGPRTSMSDKELASACAQLDDTQKRPRMDGLVFKLAVLCDRRDELGKVTSEKFDADQPTNRVPGTDARVNDPSGETGATQTQNENSIARSDVTGTLCSGFNDSYSGVITNQGFTGFSRSTDDGVSFVDGGAFDANSFGDPSMIWRRADSNFYLATLHSNGLGIYRSTDDCQTMNFLTVGHVGGSDDKELLAVDNNPGNSTYGRMYMVWTDFIDERIYSTYSDNGTTWSTPVALSDPGADVQGAWPIVAPDGTVYVAWVRWNPYFSGPMDMEVVRSTDGGVSYSRTTNPLTGAINPYSASETLNCGRPALRGNIRYLPSPQIAVTPNGDLHIAYSYDPDGRDVGDVVDVFYRRSTDQGQTWLPEIRVNDDTTQTDQFFPSISAGPTGRVVIAWYDRRLDEAGNLFVDYYAAMSEDGGASFGPNERISDESSPIYIDPGLASCYHGDYDQQLQTASSAFIQWSDDRAIRSGHNDPDTYIDQNIFQPDFFVSSPNSAASICAPDSASFDVDIGQSLGFSDPVSLSVSGEPAGSTTAFSINPVIPAGSSVLTIGNTAAARAGTFTIDVTGISDTGSRAAQLSLTLALSTPAASRLSLPADGAIEQSTTPTFSWTGEAQAAGYLVEIASDAAFTDIVASDTTIDPSYTAQSNLAPDTTYYWRVTASNQCGTGVASAGFSFTTANFVCVTAGLNIPDGEIQGIDSETTLAATGLIDDLDITINATHTYVGDLIFTLTHNDTGTSAVIVDRPGRTTSGFGCSGNDVSVTLDDEAAAAVEDQCSTSGIAIDGTFTPDNPLSVFDGEELAGSWTLNASDNASIDVGTINEWCILSALQATATDTDGDGVTDDVDNCSNVSNPAQTDSNGDGFGNACDADLNNDCVVNSTDLGLLRLVFFTADADADLDGDGLVNATDLGLMRLAFFQPPGPASEPNACTPVR